MRWTIGRNASIAPISAGATPISTPPTMPLVCGLGSAIEDDHGGSDKTAGLAGRRLDRRPLQHFKDLRLYDFLIYPGQDRRCVDAVVRHHPARHKMDHRGQSCSFEPKDVRRG